MEKTPLSPDSPVPLEISDREQAQACLRKEGRLWLRSVLTEETLDRYSTWFAEQGLRGRRVPRARDIEAPELCAALEPVLPGGFAVRTLAFDKAEGRNWGVPWHQDRVVAVSTRCETEHAANWSRKGGV